MKAKFPAPSCNNRGAGQVTWDVAPAQLDAAELWVGSENDRQIVSAGGVTHTTDIQGWAGPGEIFTLREQGGGKELDRITLPGEPCLDK
ncbi:hypothetical protein [Pseudoxanthomonas suwonensis]|uniref:hypothetical protein n=1 Tax=Pseudoxanthomonas suwonensis TaxID=314722 RepID=UPI0012DE61FA|nr:hypothetical protein [Pseudoxanthomonas suwonensis]